jgi:hypothetical protein
MTGKTKEVDEPADPQTSDCERNTESDDVAERPYYYDDAHGYQEFDPEAEDGDAAEG